MVEIEMPTTIYDASQITQRRMNKAQSGDFVNRIQNGSSSLPGYASRLGIYDQSIINVVKTGRMAHYRKQDGGVTMILNGCPCAPLSGSDAVFGTN
jgi:hypothetical protein